MPEIRLTRRQCAYPMITNPRVVEKMERIPKSDTKYCSTAAIEFWELVKAPHFASGAMQLRIRVTYPNRAVRMVAGSFADRRSLDDYIDRWLPRLLGKEKSA